MHALRSAIARHPIPAYIAIAFVFSWTFTALVSVSVALVSLPSSGPGSRPSS